MKRFVCALAMIAAITFSDVKAQSCGDVVVSSVTLTTDLINCPDTGLLVAASGVTVRLNGHTIDGIGNSSGIGVPTGFNNVRVIGPGTIREFATGVAFNVGDGHVVSGVLMQDNQSGIYAIDVANAKFKSNEVVSGINGIILQGALSQDNTISDNYIAGVISEAIWLYNASRNEVTGNYLIHNQTGFAITSGSRNSFSYNRVIENMNGITIATTAGGGADSSYNEIFWNKIYDNRSGVYLSTFGTTLNNVKNQFYKNAIRGGDGGLLIGDAGNIKTLVDNNWFASHGSYHITDLGTMSQFSGNRCDGVACP